VNSNGSAVPSVEVPAPRSSSRSRLGLRLGGTVLGGPSCGWLMLVSAMNFPLGREVFEGSILPVILRVGFLVPVPFRSMWFKQACLTQNHDCKAGHATATW
jgi:hypothetical protein